jgi:succinyl-diaminopimelate desuccinylase
VLAAEVGSEDAPVTVWWEGHLDVVRGRPDQYKPCIEDGRLIGRGGLDMLGAICCMVHALPHVAAQDEVRVRLVLVGDEEVSPPHSIADYMAMLAEHERPHFVITGEPTDLQVAWATKGVVILRFVISGIGGHSSIPWKLSNPIDAARRLAAGLEALPFTQQTTPEYPEGPSVALTAFRAGRLNAPTSIPSLATVVYSVRPLPSQTMEAVVGEVRGLVDELSSGLPRPIQMEASHLFSPVVVSPESPYVRALCSAVSPYHGGRPVLRVQHGAGDLSFIGVPGVEFGLAGFGHHGEEYVRLDSFVPYTEALLRQIRLLPEALRHEKAS